MKLSLWLAVLSALAMTAAVPVDDTAPANQASDAKLNPCTPCISKYKECNLNCNKPFPRPECEKECQLAVCRDSHLCRYNCGFRWCSNEPPHGTLAARNAPAPVTANMNKKDAEDTAPPSEPQQADAEGKGPCAKCRSFYNSCYQDCNMWSRQPACYRVCQLKTCESNADCRKCGYDQC